MLLLKLGRPSLIGFPTLLTSGGIAIKSQKTAFSYDMENRYLTALCQANSEIAAEALARTLD